MSLGDSWNQAAGLEKLNPDFAGRAEGIVVHAESDIRILYVFRKQIICRINAQ